MTAAPHKSYFELTKDTPYLTLTGEVCCEDFGETWSCYNGTALYQAFIMSSVVASRKLVFSYSGIGIVEVTLPIENMSKIIRNRHRTWLTLDNRYMTSKLSVEVMLINCQLDHYEQNSAKS